MSCSGPTGHADRDAVSRSDDAQRMGAPAPSRQPWPSPMPPDGRRRHRRGRRRFTAPPRRPRSVAVMLAVADSEVVGAGPWEPFRDHLVGLVRLVGRRACVPVVIAGLVVFDLRPVPHPSDPEELAGCTEPGEPARRSRGRERWSRACRVPSCCAETSEAGAGRSWRRTGRAGGDARCQAGVSGRCAAEGRGGGGERAGDVELLRARDAVTETATIVAAGALERSAAFSVGNAGDPSTVMVSRLRCREVCQRLDRSLYSAAAGAVARRWREDGDRAAGRGGSDLVRGWCCDGGLDGSMCR